MADDEVQVPRVVINPQVTYDVGELLDKLGTRIDSGFARIEQQLSEKADKADLAGINARLDEHGKEIGRLKDRQREDEAAAQAINRQKTSTADSRQKRINVAISVALVVVSALGVMTAVFHW